MFSCCGYRAYNENHNGSVAVGALWAVAPIAVLWTRPEIPDFREGGGGFTSKPIVLFKLYPKMGCGSLGLVRLPLLLG